MTSLLAPAAFFRGAAELLAIVITALAPNADDTSRGQLTNLGLRESDDLLVQANLIAKNPLCCAAAGWQGSQVCGMLAVFAWPAITGVAAGLVSGLLSSTSF